MGHSHDHTHTDDDTPLGRKHARALKAVLGINSAMVVIEGVSGYIAHSASMVADTLDMLSDAVGAGMGLAVRKRSKKWQAGTALAKAVVMGALGVGVLVGAALAFFNPIMPIVATMGIIGGLALAANAACVALLYPYRNDNINIKSTMMCSQNDMVANIAVIGAAAVAHVLVSPVPDLIVGIAVAGLFIKSSVDIARESIAILRSPDGARQEPPEKPPAPQKPSPKPSPKIVLGFKKVIRNVFNRKAADTPKAPVPAPAQPPAAVPPGGPNPGPAHP